MKRTQLLGLLVPLGLLTATMTIAPAEAAQAFPSELQPLLAALKRARYSVMLEPPPVKGAYGLTDSRKRKIWIAPITQELGILRATLIHEAVHAAQGCPDGRQLPIGWTVQLEHSVDREISGLLFQRYPHGSHELEREAFGMQSHPRALSLLISALNRRCR